MKNIKQAYGKFIDLCYSGDANYRLTPKSDETPFGLCFAIFGKHLIKDIDFLVRNRDEFDKKLRENLDRLYNKRKAATEFLFLDKEYLQLLTFTLSALSVLSTLSDSPLEKHILPILSSSSVGHLESAGVFDGKARTGNLAMFHAILHIHAKLNMGINTNEFIDEWIRKHFCSMNQFGFWGEANSMSHLQFQNGYHQYEILEYLNVEQAPWDLAASSVALLVDAEGHFAPYPGGGGCYDYDAIFLLTADTVDREKYRGILELTLKNIIDEQNSDGGFCESTRIRPRSIQNIKRSFTHVISAKGRARYERFRYAITLLRPVHDRIHTHWSKYSREWNESDLWDSWFRMLTIARIQTSLSVSEPGDWGFINFPGIGYHGSLGHCWEK